MMRVRVQKPIYWLTQGENRERFVDSNLRGFVLQQPLYRMNQCKVMNDGYLEKRSNGLLQLWKKKRCVLSDEGLRLYGCKGDSGKEMRFEQMTTLDCVEYKRGLVYFTIVMNDGKEVDFRCQQEGTAWNAEIALALVRFKNRVAVQTGRNRHLSHLGSCGEGDVEL